MKITKKPMFVGLFSLILVIAILFFSLYSSIGSSVAQIVVTAPPAATSTPTVPTPAPDPDAAFGVLLLGFRGDGSKGGYLSDTMMVGYVEPKKQSISLISIPRDLWVKLPISDNEERYFKINHAFAVGVDNKLFPNKLPQYQGPGGGGQLAKKIVEEATGLNIPYFVAVNFNGFTKTIDTLGGIDVNVARAFEDKYFPIPGMEDDPCGKSETEMKALEATVSGYLLEQQYTCRFETLSFPQGKVTMDGVTALKYARSRHSESDGNDFARSERQKQVMLAVRGKVVNIGFITRALPFIQSLGGSVWTDIDSGVVTSFMPRFQEFRQYKVRSINISTANALKESRSNDRQYILIPNSGIDNFQSIKDFIQAEINK
jgi:polyisoprenyl-teichoic acid--peptidoglycan teichoic acid transferase